MVFVQALHDIESFLGGEAVTLIGFTLQGSQIIECRRVCLFCFPFYFGYMDSVSCIFADLIDFISVKCTAGAGLGVSPYEADAACVCLQPVIWFWYKFFDLFFSDAIMARVGVCTLPQESCALYLQVSARVALMPTTQSASALATAA